MFYREAAETANPERTAERLLTLKQAMRDSGVPEKSAERLLLATWNIREFDAATYGERSLECLLYIAEVCSNFDLIAVQEVREDLTALQRVRDLLGGQWKYIVSDVSGGTPGNRERMAFLYDDGKVCLNNVAGEVVIPPIEVKENGKTIRYDPSRQLYRTPYMVGFKAGWCELMLCTVHIAYGKSKKDDPTRVREIQLIADYLAKRSRERTNAYSNLVLLGDFNIFGRGDVTFQALIDAGFEVPEELQSVPASNTGNKGRHYDQIAFMPKKWRMETTGQAGVFDFFDSVYRLEDEKTYASEMGSAYKKSSKGKVRDAKGKTKYYKTYWRTFQMSDHLPMWIEIKTDFSREYLEELKEKSAAD